MKKVIRILNVTIILLTLSVNLLFAQATLYSETFTAANNTVVGAGNPASWNRNLNGSTPVNMSVQSNVFRVTNSGGEVIWNSRPIYIQGWEYVTASVEMPIKIEKMEVTDYINFYYKIDGGTETLFATNGNNTGNFDAGRIAQQKNLKGHTLEIVVRIKNNANDEIHYFDKVTVSGSNRFYEEDFNAYADGATTSSLWTINSSNATTFSVQSEEFQYRNSAQMAIWSSSVMDISSFSSVNLQVTLKEKTDNKLENSDWIEVLYILNGGAETRFGTNGYFTDDFPSPYTFVASHNNLSGSTIQIIIKAKTNANDEYYYWDDVFMTANMPTPPLLQLSTSSVNVTGCEEGNTNGGVTLSVTNGLSPFTYSWSNGATTRNLANVGTGNYTVTVTDFNGATTSTSQAVTHPTLMNVSVTKTPPTKSYSLDGKIELDVIGGTSPFTFAWNNSKTTQDIDSIDSGSYTWLVKDALGCEKTNMEYLTYSDTIPVGSFIINMGVTPQTIANGLKPYGLIYQLVRNYKVPVIWSISPDKSKDGIDFSYNGVDYKGGTFVIDEGFITNDVKDLITTWQGKGVVGVYTSTPIAVPIYQKVTGFASLVVDIDNEGLIIPYFNNAEIPSSIYSVGLPSSLGDCHDFFILPHADPTWAEHGNLYTFNRTRKGNIWAGCHAISMLEGVKNPSENSQQMNFLTKTGLQCYSAGKCGDNGEVHTSAHTAPTIYETKYNSHPIMQLMGDMTGATDNGSERWYIPATNGGWNDNVARALKTSDGSQSKEGAKLAFGYGYNNPLNGIVMYEGGHTAHNNGTVPERVAAQRAFFNFILHASIEKFITTKGEIPTTFINMQGQTVSVTTQGGNPPYTYQWSATLPGNFSNPDSSVTEFTPTGGQVDKSHFITCVIQDACGRINYVSTPIEFFSISGTTTNVVCNGTSTGSIDVTVIGGTPPYSYLWSNGATTQDLTNIPAGEYEVLIADVSGYSENKFFEIIQTKVITDSAIITPATGACLSDGAIELFVEGGNLNYTYSWTTGATTKDISALAKGNYTVTITDQMGCSISSTITVTGPANVSIIFSATNVATYKDSTGILEALVSGGNSPYNYSWCNGEATAIIIDKKAGPYSLNVTDHNGCTATASGVIGIDNATVFTGIQAAGVTQLTWNSSTNWTGGTLPNSATNVVIPAGCATTVIIPANASVNDLIITEGAHLIINGTSTLQIDGNLILDGTLTTGIGTVNFIGAAEQNIYTSEPTQFYNLSINNSSETGLRIDTNIIIQNQLSLNNGKIFTQENDTVIVTNTASNAVINHSAQSYIIGNITRHIVNSGIVNYDFPLGYGASSEYFNATINARALKSTTKITGTVKPLERSQLFFTSEEEYNISDSAINYVRVHPEAMWILEPNVQPTGGSYDIKLYTQNFSNLTDNYFGIIKRNAGGTDADWVANFAEINPIGEEGRIGEHGYALKKGATSFSEFAIGSGSSISLPIELLMFDARINDDSNAHLEWYTATEIDNDYFTVERIQNFYDKPTIITTVKGAGNSNTLNKYTTIDDNPLEGVSYYRLKQTDYDGMFTYSNWVSITNKKKTKFAFKIYPNPATTFTNLSFKNIEGNINILIFDIASRIILSKNFVVDSEHFTHKISVSENFIKGNYFVQAIVNGEIFLQRFTVQ